MANECLVTKLKGVVNNNNLPKFGKIKLTRIVSDPDWQNKYFVFSGPSDRQVTVSSDDLSQILMVDNGQDVAVNLPFSYPLSAGRKFKFGDVNKSIYFDNKYDIALATMYVGPGFEVDVETVQEFLLNKSVAITEFNLNGSGLRGNIVDFADFVNLTGLYLDDTNVEGNISDLPNKANFAGLYCSNTNVAGTMAQFGAMTNINIIKVDGAMNITGDIVDFITAAVSAGKTSCLIADGPTIEGYRNHIYIFGNIVSWLSPAYLSWEGTSKIGIYLGDRIPRAGVTIYAKGYSSVEIQTMRDAGAAVIEVE